MTNRQVESLLEHHSFLCALARSLVRNDVEADDIVQETWLVALKSPKRPEEVRRSWLAGIVRNLVRRRHRDGERRHRRERIAARAGAVEATDDACAERSMRRRIAEVVVALPERYREPLLLRYYDGLTPQAIAARLGLPGSTVRTRIQRGLARVRAGLEAGNGNGHALSLLLAAIAAERPARRATGIALRAACAAGVGAVGLLLARAAPEAPPRSAHEARALASRAAAAAAEAPVGADAPAAREASGGEPLVSVPLLLEGVVHLPAGAAARTVRLDLAVAGAMAERHAQVEGDAPFALDMGRLEEGAAALRVRATHPEAEPAEATVAVRGDGRLDRLHLHLRRRLLVPAEKLAPGHLEAAAELASPGASAGARAPGGAALSPGAEVVLEGVVRLPPDASGAPVLLELWRPGAVAVRAGVHGGARFSLDATLLVAEPRPASLRLRASHPDALPDESDVPVLFDPGTGRILLPYVSVELRPVAYLEGAVELEGFGPAADATVAAFDWEGDVPGAEVLVAAATGPGGRFRLPVARGRRHLVVGAAPGYTPAGVAAAVEGGTELPVLLLRRGVVISGQVRHGEEPGVEAVVRATLPEAGGSTLRLGDGRAIAWSAEGVAWRHVAATAGADGAFEIPGLEPRAYRVELEALADGEVPWAGAREVLAPGTVDFDLPVARLAVHVRGSGAPLARASVVALRAGGAAPARHTDGAGVASVAARPGEALRLAVSATGFVPAERDVAAPGSGTLDVTFDLQPETRLATLIVTLRSEQGLALPANCAFDLLPLDGGRPAGRTATVEDGKFALREIEPGNYDVIATPGGPTGPFLPAAGRVRLGRGETASLSLDVRAGGRIAVRIVGAGGVPGLWLEGAADGGLWPQGIGTDGAGANEWSWSGDTLVSGLLAPGTYVLHVLRPDGTGSIPIEVRAGETAKISVSAAR